MESRFSLDDYSEKALYIIIASSGVAQSFLSNTVELEHLLFSLASVPETVSFSILKRFELGLKALRDSIERLSFTKKAAANTTEPSPTYIFALNSALEEAHKDGFAMVSDRHLFLGFIRAVEVYGGVSEVILSEFNITPSALREQLCKEQL
ncbi:Clp protease N-terminal domain-containing protein [Gloeobacter kilaueensis]|uniref:ATPases with chaperone activity, ATP-binding subunit n=1 Tax=Gloeobacter kilaueensis (strain ATCC BAA-2537 / CCAP 1431/1 / ULC 316 / JS1) TaxID=1183438 RepID=U5QPI8_GLOK1|nr:Clp protease N-terminal domain-containing protein [Gloeobacter kilaueensis]AGY59605.1 ATPases with chaperone activity, ATP-binding subunit [Gloeobacter kilaueensis JS1]